MFFDKSSSVFPLLKKGEVPLCAKSALSLKMPQNTKARIIRLRLFDKFITFFSASLLISFLPLQVRAPASSAMGNCPFAFFLPTKSTTKHRLHLQSYTLQFENLT